MTVIRSDVVGSLLRPEPLKEARRRWEAGELSAAGLKHIEDRAVDDAIRLQEDAGLDVVTDGELRRYAFFGHLIEALDGFDKFGGWAIPFHDDHGGELVFKRPVVVEKLAARHSMCAEEWVYLRARATRPGKVTLISCQQAAAYYDPDKSAAAYPTRDAYLADVVDLTRREVGELVRLGCTYIQIDAPQYAALLDPALQMVTNPSWFRRLSQAEKDAVSHRQWAEGRLKVEPWLEARLKDERVSVWPQTELVSCTEQESGELVAALSNGETLNVDQVVLATGYKVDIARLPVLAAGNLLERLETRNDFPVLDDHFETSVPGLFITSMPAMQEFGPFFGFTVSVRTSAKLICQRLRTLPSR